MAAEKDKNEMYSMIGNIFQGAFTAAGAITTAVIEGKTQRVSLETNASMYNTDSTQKGKSTRTIVIAVCAVAAIAVFGIFVWSNRRK